MMTEYRNHNSYGRQINQSYVGFDPCQQSIYNPEENGPYGHNVSISQQNLHARDKSMSQKYCSQQPPLSFNDNFDEPYYKTNKEMPVQNIYQQYPTNIPRSNGNETPNSYFVPGIRNPRTVRNEEKYSPIPHQNVYSSPHRRQKQLPSLISEEERQRLRNRYVVRREK